METDHTVTNRSLCQNISESLHSDTRSDLQLEVWRDPTGNTAAYIENLLLQHQHR